MVVLKRSLSLAGVFTAIILGAGFASGQELMSFFARFGRAGFLGIITAGAVFALVGWAVMDMCRGMGINGYSMFSERILGRRIGILMETVVTLFLFVLFSTMLAATGSALREAFGLPQSFGAALMSGICFMLFMGGIDRIVRISAVLAPIMIVGGVFVGLLSFFKPVPVFLQLGPNNWFVSSVVYASYNIITAVTVLTALGGHTDRLTVFLGPFLGALAVSALGVCMSLPLFTRFLEVSGAEIPLLRLAMSQGRAIELIYLVVLLSAIATTAAANGYSFSEWLGQRFGVGPVARRLAVCLAGFFAAGLGFSGFVSGIYPLFGYIGLFQILVILISHWGWLASCRRR